MSDMKELMNFKIFHSFPKTKSLIHAVILSIEVLKLQSCNFQKLFELFNNLNFILQVVFCFISNTQNSNET